MSESTTHLSTATKRKHEEEDAGDADKTTDLVAAETEKKSKFREETASPHTDINENQTTALDNKLKTNDEVGDQEQSQSEEKDARNNIVNNSEKIPVNEQVPTVTAINEENTPNNVETNESASLDNNLAITKIAKETTGSELRAKAQDKNHNALTKKILTTEDTNERTIAPPNVDPEQCQPRPIAGKVSMIPVNEEKTMENPEFNTISNKTNKLVQNYIEKDVLTEGNDINSHVKSKCYQPTQKLYAVLKEPKDSKPPEYILQRGDATKLIAKIKASRILIPSSLSVTVKQRTDKDGIKNSVLPKKVIQPSVTIVPIERKTKDEECNSETDNGGVASNTTILPISSNTISTLKVPKQSNSSIYPTGLITKRMVVKNISGGTLATAKKAIVSTQQFTPAPTATTLRKIIPINRNKLTPISYKDRNCVYFPPLRSKRSTSAHDKPIMTSVEYIPKNHSLSIGSAADKSINSKLLNDKKANGININDFCMEDLTITADSISTSNTNEQPTAPKSKKLKVCDSASIPTLTPAYLKALSVYIEEAKKAHKAATIELKDSSSVENSISKDKRLETIPVVTKNSISKERSDFALENESSKDESSKTNTDADEQLDVEKSSQAKSSKSITYSDDQLDANKISDTESTKGNIDVDEQLDTGSISVEKESNRDSLENDDVQCKTVEIEKGELSQAFVTNYEEANAGNGKEIEKKKNDANHGESEQCEKRETQQMISLERKATKDTTECTERMDVTESSDIQCETGIPEKLDNTDGEKNSNSEENVTQKIVAESGIPQIEADAAKKNHDERGEIVIEEKKDILDSEKYNSKGVDVEKQAINQNKSPHCGTDESEKMEVDESSAESRTRQIEIEVCDVAEKRKLDFVDDYGDQPEDAEVEKQIMNQNNSGTNKGELKLDSESVSPQSVANKECKVVEEENTNCVEVQSEEFDIEKQSLDQNKVTQCDIDDSDKREVDESGGKQTVVDNFEDHSVANDSNSTCNNESLALSENESTKDSYINSSSKDQDIDFHTDKGTRQTVDETVKINLAQSSSAQYENENKSISESYATQCEYENNKLNLNASKNTENASDVNYIGVSSQCETEGTQTIPDIGTVFNTVYSNKCNAFTQTNDSTIKLLENISALRRKVRRQADEIVSLNAAMKLLDTANLLKTFDN